METRDQIEAILRNKYNNKVERKGNRFKVFFDLSVTQRRERIAELNNIYQFLKGTLQRRVALNPRGDENESSIGSVDIVEEYKPFLPEIKIYAKPEKIPPNLRPGIRNEEAFQKVIQEALDNTKGLNKDVSLNIIPRGSGSMLKISKVNSIIRSNLDNPNFTADFSISGEGAIKNISLKKSIFRNWTRAGTLKKEVENLLDDAFSKGVIIKPGTVYKFNPKSSFTGVARRATLKEIRDKIFGTKIDVIVISNITENDLIWDDNLKSLSLYVDRCYQKEDAQKMLSDVYLYVKKGSNFFGKYRGFDAQFVPSSVVEASTMISSI